MSIQNSKRGVTLIAICVAFAILAIIVGMLTGIVGLAAKSANKSKIGTENSADAWKTTGNLTPSANIKTWLLTDPTTGQKWVVVQCAYGVTLSPYNSNISVSKDIKVEGQEKD